MPDARGRIRILVVEDAPSLVKCMVDILTCEGYKPQGVNSAVVALQNVQQQRPDLLITDVIMPEMDGYQLIKTLRSNPTTATFPIIVLSGCTDPGFIREGLSLGASVFVKKPFQFDEFVNVVSHVLARSIQ